MVVVGGGGDHPTQGLTGTLQGADKVSRPSSLLFLHYSQCSSSLLLRLASCSGPTISKQASKIGTRFSPVSQHLSSCLAYSDQDHLASALPRPPCLPLPAVRLPMLAARATRRPRDPMLPSKILAATGLSIAGQATLQKGQGPSSVACRAHDATGSTPSMREHLTGLSSLPCAMIALAKRPSTCRRQM